MTATISVGANTTLSGVASGIPSGLVVQPIPTWKDDVVRRDTPLMLAMKEVGPSNQNSTTLLWGWSSLRPLRDQVNEALDDTETSIIVDNQSYFQVGDVIQIEAEQCLVTAYDSTNALTVVRGFAGTTAANHNDNSGIMILGPAFRENQDTTLVPIAQGETNYNYYQQFEHKLAASHQRQHIDSYETMGKGKALEYFSKKRVTKEIPIEQERKWINGLRAAQTASLPASAGGVLQPAYTTNSDSVSGALTPTQLLDSIYDTWASSQDDIGLDIMCHPNMARRISSWFSGMRTAEATDDTVRMHFTRFITPYGTLTLMPNRHWVEPGTVDGVPEKEMDVILIANFKNFELVPFSTDSKWNLTYRKSPYNDSWSDVAFMRGIYSLRIDNPYQQTIISGFSTSAADYPGSI